MLNNYEKVGRWLCRLYYAPASRKNLPQEIIHIIETTVLKSSNLAWISLLSGDLRKKTARKNFLGDVVIENMQSLDGDENCVRFKELVLYSIIGLNIYKFLTT